MHFSTLSTAICVALFAGNIAAGSYVLEDDYSTSSFFRMFDFFTSGDPTAGFVQYVDQGTAQNSGLIKTEGNSLYIGVDSTNVTPNGRPSVRLTSTKSYNHALVILDLEHMPGGACGTWPAFWMVGPNWPSSGEIDIIEGVNQQAANAMTLHTGPGCSITNNNAFSGSMSTSNCDINAAGQASNAGCGITTGETNSYGTGFNAGGGGVYAMEWTSSAISVYFFPRGSIPSDISGGSPNPSGWGKPLSQFEGGCNIDQFFTNQQIVFDVTFCGAWAGSVWSSSSCASQASTCNAFVENNPSAFSDTYWSINSLKVYQTSSSSAQKNVAMSSNPASASTAASTASSTSVAHSTTATPTTLIVSTKPASSATATFSALPASMFHHHTHTTTKPASPAETPAAASPAPVLLESSWFPSGGQTGGIPVSRKMSKRWAHLLGHRRRAHGGDSEV